MEVEALLFAQMINCSNNEAFWFAENGVKLHRSAEHLVIWSSQLLSLALLKGTLLVEHWTTAVKTQVQELLGSSFLQK